MATPSRLNISQCLVIALLALVNVLLLWHTRSLQRQLSAFLPSTIPIGYVIRPFTAVSADNSEVVEVEFGPSAPKTLLITFSSTCPACYQNFDNWVNLVTHPRLSEWRVIWVSRDPLAQTAAFFEENEVRGDVLAQVEARSYYQLHLNRVPQMMALDESGKALAIWSGLFAESEWNSINNFFLDD